MEGTPERRARQIVLGAAILVAGGAIAAVGATQARRAPSDDAVTLLATFAAELCFACIALGGALLVGRRVLPRGLRLERPRFGPGEIALVVAGFVCVSHALSLVLSLLTLRSSGTLGEIDEIVSDAQGPLRALVFVTLALAPAIAEELLFRGFLQQSLRRPLGAMGAILVASLAFGAVHLDAAQSPAAFVLGLYLGAVVEFGGSLLVTILCHALNNSLALLASASMEGAAAAAEAEVSGDSLGYAFTALALFSVGVFLLFAVVRRRRAVTAAAALDPASPPGEQPPLDPLRPPSA